MKFSINGLQYLCFACLLV